MFQLSNIRLIVRCCSKHILQTHVRTKKIKVENIPIINRWREDKQLFGPILPKKKKTKNNGKNAITSNTTHNVDVNNDNNKEDNYHLSEIIWNENKSNTKKIQLINHDQPKNQTSAEQESIELSKISKTQIADDMDVNKTNDPIASIVENNSVTFKKVNDVPELSNVTSNENNSTCIPANFPLFDTVKYVEQWDDVGFISPTIMNKNDYRLPGVTTILNQTASEESKLILEKWKQKMILELGEIGFEKYMKDQQEDSKLMHSLISDFLYKKEITIPDRLNATFHSMNLILKHINKVRSLESHVIHPDLHYRGIIDCVAYYRGNLCLIDWKKSDKIKTLKTTYDLPLQLSAYVGALNSDPNYPFKVKTAVLAIAYSSGQPPSLLEFREDKLQFYWKEWLKRLQKYYLMKSTRSL